MNTKTISVEMLEKQIRWENHQVEEGVAKYQKAMVEKSMNGTTGGQRLISNALPRTIAAINEAYLEVDDLMFNNTHGGGVDNWVYMIGLVSAEQTAVIALNKAFAFCSEGSSDTVSGLSRKQTSMLTRKAGLNRLAKSIGQALRQQLKFENWKAKSKAESIGVLNDKGDQVKKSYAELLIARAKGQINNRKLGRWEKKFDNYANIDWGTDVVKIGFKIIDILVAANPGLFNYETKRELGKTQRFFYLTEEAWSEYQSCEDFAELQSPYMLPTLIAPVPFAYVDGKVRGGYHHIESPLFSNHQMQHTSADKTAASERFLSAVNNVQATMWKINPFILMVVDMLYGTGAEVGGVTQACHQVTPALNSDAYAALSKKERSAYHSKRKDAIEKIASARGKHGAFRRKIEIAHKMAQHSEFAFPHFADFRGRLYPYPKELTPQGDQVAKALLMFAKGKELGTSGLKWLKIHAANCYGKDKETLFNRELWATFNLDLMIRVASDPLTNEEWTAAAEPLLFLAAAKELARAHESGDPTTFVSHIPVAIDGTTNGMQILSMLGKDQVGAEATNCTAKDERFDLYATVAASVLSILSREAGGSEIAAEWLERLQDNPGKSRGLVKRAVMCVPYGVTPRGIAEQLVGDKHCNDFECASRADASVYMTDCILEAMTSVNGKAVEIMSYFQKVSGIIAKAELPLSWTTPMGLRVTQAYNKTSKREIKTVLGDVILHMEDQKLGLDARRQAQSSAPNIIHSFDGALLQLTVEKMANQGHTDFAMIHDSYGMHASAIEDLNAALRLSALEIFQEDQIQAFHEQMVELSGLDLPEPPARGEYRIEEIEEAPYFFS